MRVHALESSGSMSAYMHNIFCALKTYADPMDFIIQFDTQVSKARLWSEVLSAGYESLQMMRGGTLIQPVFDWMDARFLLPTDELIIYSDFYVPDMPAEDTYYTTKFVDVVKNNIATFPNDNVFRIGQREEGYCVLPWKDHPCFNV